MRGTVKQRVSQLNIGHGLELRHLLMAFADRIGNRVVNAPGLAIKSGSSVLVKAANAFHAIMSDNKVGRLVAKGANTDMAALSGTVVNATHNVFTFFMDKTGTLTSAMGMSGASLGAITLPAIPSGSVMIGYVYINPTGTGDFVGGTTALDDGTVVPNAIYRDTIGVFDPTIVP